jgi:hypothetical protein
MARIGMVILSVASVLVLFSINLANAQVQTTQQVTLSGDLANDPVAQDILKKIEESKKQIEKLQQRDFERLQAKKELEERRTKAVGILQSELKEWEKLWEEFTFEYRFKKLGEKHSSGTSSGIFWDQHNYTNSKISAGRAALTQVIKNGGSPEEARFAYVDAAKVKRSELIDVNAIFNVQHNLAIYGQQILFDSNGKFHDVISGEELRKYYEDFRTNPAYLDANKNDTKSWSAFSNDASTKCREGYVLVYRYHAQDHTCVTEQTSELWTSRGMGKIISETPSVEQKTGKLFLTIEQLREDRLEQKIKNINNKINSMYDLYDKKLDDLGNKYELLGLDYDSQKREEEKKIIREFEAKSISKEEMTRRITDVRAQYDILKETVLKEKIKSFEIMESKYKKELDDFVTSLETSSDVQIVVINEKPSYRAIKV